MSAADVSNIGAHCSLEQCNVNDFLPIKCRCDRVFCKDHISPDSHSCAVLNAKSDAPPTQSTERLQRCAAERCNKPSLEAFIAEKSALEGRTPALCPRCKQAFCASHREPASHACAAEPEQQPVKNEAGRALLAKIFPAETSKTTQSTIPAKRKAPPKDPKKAAQLRQVELMKMRHKAQPGDPKDKNKHVPIDQKLHVKVCAVEKGDEERIFWFSKTIIAGRALDMLATHFGVSSDSAPLCLEKPSAEEVDGTTRLANDKPLSEQVEDGGLLVLSR